MTGSPVQALLPRREVSLEKKGKESNLYGYSVPTKAGRNRKSRYGYGASSTEIESSAAKDNQGPLLNYLLQLFRV